MVFLFLYKSGSKKGTARIIKSKAISTLNLKSFNDGLLRVLSIKNNSTDSLETSVDEWILTSPLCDTIDELIYRYNNVNCSQSKLKVHKLYIADTIEEASLKRKSYQLIMKLYRMLILILVLKILMILFASINIIVTFVV